jgi:hypothetical protein
MRPGGAHRAPDPEPEPEPAPEPEPVQATEPEPGPTQVISRSSVPSEQATSVIRTTTPAEPPPAEPTYEAPPGYEPPPSYATTEPAAANGNRKLIVWFSAACAALLAVLVFVIIYGVFINKADTVAISSGKTSTSKSAAPSTTADSGSGNSTQTQSESPTTASTSGAQASDGGLDFAVTNVENAPSVKYQDAPVTKNAQGEFLIVHMTVSNPGGEQGTFLATLQKLKAGGTEYSIDDEATAYLNGTWADLQPGDKADVAIAFDVPPGTSGESLEVHGQPMSSGADVPLS